MQRTRFDGKRSINGIMKGRELGTIMIFKSASDLEKYVPIYYGEKTDEWFCVKIKLLSKQIIVRKNIKKAEFLFTKFTGKLKPYVWDDLKDRLLFYENSPEVLQDDFKIVTS